MSKIKELLLLAELTQDEHDNGEGIGYQSNDWLRAIREAKAEHEQLTAYINSLTPSSFRDIHVYNELKRLV